MSTGAGATAELGGQIVANLVPMALALAGGWWATGMARQWALRWGVMSEVTHRSSHSVPTPRLGGVGICAGLAAALAAGVVVHWPGAATTGLSVLIAGWLVMMATGFHDDVHDSRPLAKLALMGLGAALPAGWLLGAAGFSVGAALLAWCWILFFTNAYNFMDGMDGFAGSFAMVATLGLLGVWGVAIEGDWPLAGGQGLSELLPRASALMLYLACACVGFLRWNLPPARIFMGDGGSLSVGYWLAVYPLLWLGGRTDGPSWALGLTALTVLMPFVFDVLLTLLRRIRRRENLLQAHRSHLYQRLMQTGLSHRGVLGRNLVRFVACVGLAWWGLMTGSLWGPWLAWGAALGLMAHYWWSVLRRERAVARG